MKPRFLALFAVILCLAQSVYAQDAANAPSSLLLADFSKDNAGFTGQIQRDTTTGQTDKTSGKITGKFDDKTRWVTASRSLDITNEVTGITLWVNSSDADRLTIRVIDATGQSLQQRPSFKPDGTWQKLSVDSLTSGPIFQSWGGANDKIPHFPLKSLDLILEGNSGSKTVWVDNIELQTIGKPKSALDDAGTFTVTDFSKDIGKFTGPIKRDSKISKDENGSGIITGKLSKTGTRWVTVSHPLDLTNEVLALQFWARSEDTPGISARLIDSTGQNFQFRPRFPADGQWHQVVITNLTGGEGFQSFGGANDKSIHFPLQSLSFILEGPDGDHTVWIDQIQLRTKGKPHRPIDDAKPVSLLDFEKDTSPATGPVKRDDQVKRSGSASGLIQADASASQPVTVTFPISLPNEVHQFRFWVFPQNLSALTFRATDSQGLSVARKVRLDSKLSGTWQEVVIDDLTSPQSKILWPLKSISLFIEPKDIKSDRASVWVDDVQALVNPTLFIPDLRVEQPQLGNIYTVGESPRIYVRTKAATAKWTIENFFGAVLDSGSAPVKDGLVEIAPPITAQGYYHVTVDTFSADAKPYKSAETSFGIISAHDISKMPDSPFGAMTHFAQRWPTDILDLLAKLGVTSIRDELYWNVVEAKPNEFNFETYDPYMARCKELGIEPLIVMSFANKNYDDNKTPYTQAGFDAYARYGQEILKRYPDQVKTLEIWNEYNGSFCNGPATEDRPRFYSQMLATAFKKLKESNPNVKILGGAAVLLPLPWYEGIAKNGGLKAMDAAVIHPYRGQPEGVDEDIQELQDLVKKYNDGKSIPIWCTETGFHDKENVNGRDNVARNLPRMMTLLLAAKVEKIHWYLARDYDNFVTMGLLRAPDSPWGRYAVTPAYVAYSTLIDQLYAASFVKREEPAGRVRLYRFSKNNQDKIVAWATTPSQVTVLADAPFTVTDMMGGQTTLTPINGQAFLTLNEHTVYLTGVIKGFGQSGWFNVQPTQTVDIGQPPAISFPPAPQNTSYTVTAAGKSTALAASATSLQVSSQPQLTTGANLWWYKLQSANNAVGQGAISLDVIDPLSFSPTPTPTADQALLFTLQNGSAKTAYTASRISWDIAGQVGEASKTQSLPAGNQFILTLPARGLAPFTPTPATVSVEFSDRPPITLNTSVSLNAIAHKSTANAPAITLPAAGQVLSGKIADTADLSARITPQWDDQNLYLTIQVTDNKPSTADKLTFGLAPNTPPGTPATSWQLFELPLTGAGATLTGLTNGATPAPLANAAVAVEAQTYRITLPWPATGLTPSAGLVKLAFLLTDQDDAARPPTQLAWGQGLWPGLEPEGFNLCRLMPAQPSAALAQATITTQPLSSAPAPASGRLIADSKDDYAKDQGKNGWFYGYYNGDGAGKGDAKFPSGPYTDDDFHEMTQVQTVWGYNWGSTYKFMELTRTNAHPQAVEGRPVWAVRRWVSNVEGTARLSVTVRRPSGDGDGVGIKILLDGKVVLARLYTAKQKNTEVTYETVVTLKPGAIVDFALTPGPATDIGYDASQFSSRVTLLNP